jgi:hypothetical protein
MTLDLRNSICDNCKNYFTVKIEINIVPEDEDTSGLRCYKNELVHQCEKRLIREFVNSADNIRVTICPHFIREV